MPSVKPERPGSRLPEEAPAAPVCEELCEEVFPPRLPLPLLPEVLVVRLVLEPLEPVSLVPLVPEVPVPPSDSESEVPME